MLNCLIIFSKSFFGSFGIAIIALTIIIRLLTIPLTLKQLKSTKAMQALQPRLQEIQKKYAKNQKKMQQETMKLYKESGMNPLGCMWSYFVQFPIWIALYQSVIQAMATTPDKLLELSQHLYHSPLIYTMIPLADHFLWFNLAGPDAILAILVMASMWVLQKMSTMPSTDPKQQQMSNMMGWMMPLMFGFLCLSFPSGLSLYFIISNIVSIAIQYFVTGWGTLSIPSLPRRITSRGIMKPEVATDPITDEKEVKSGKFGDKRKNRR
jgi:YidC/Oxa1 family membrane protein insertase